MATFFRQILGSVTLCAVFLSFVLAEHVVVLNHESFDDFIAKTEFAVVEFYAPWCGHCKQLAPEYEKAAEILKERGSKAVLANVDADDKNNKGLAKKYKVEGFPTIKIFRNGVPEDYDGPREADGIVQYVLKQSGPPSVEFTTKEAAESFIEEHQAVVVGVFTDFESPDAKSFLSVAATLKNDYAFAHSKDPSVFPEKDVPFTAPHVRIYKKYDEGLVDIKTFEKEVLKKSIVDGATPLVIEMSQELVNRPHLTRAFESPKPKALLFYSYEDADDHKPLVEGYHAVAKTGAHDVLFIIGDDKVNSHALEYFGVSKESTPALLVHDQSSDKKYVKEKVSAAEIDQFLSDFAAGKLVSKIKTEPVPEDNTAPVTILVATNFDDIVFKSGKNVLVEFYAPWCGHCKKLAPIYEKIGEKFKDDDSVIIAKIDATANDVPRDKFDVKGFPTLYFVDAEGEVTLYEGKRTKKAISAFVKKNKKEVATKPEGTVTESDAEGSTKDEL